MHPDRLLRPALATLTLAALAAAAAALAGAGQGGDGRIYACRHQGKDGRLRAVDAPGACRKHELPLSWSTDGERLESVDQLAGLTCGPDGEGHTSVSLNGAADVVLHCDLPRPAVRINEVMTGAAGALGDEFVEIVNAGPKAGDAGGYRIVYRSASGAKDVVLAVVPAGTIIAPGGLYLFGGAGYSGTPPANQSYGLSLSSTAGGVALRDPDGAVVDSLGYGPGVSNGFVEGAAAPAPPLADPPGASLSRASDAGDTDDNAADFYVTSPPTPGER